MVHMSEKEYKSFIRALNKWNALYDENEMMVKKPFSSPGYHTKLKEEFVHPTRDSLSYAVALLDSGIEKYRLRAIDILKKVISLQDKNPSHDTYGIWSWFYEEPLDKMSPPDWNWADFCGKELLQVASDHKSRIPGDIFNTVKSSILCACKSIMKRNMGPHYTNISIMGTYVTLFAGELFGEDEIFSYAKKRLIGLHKYNMDNGDFTEYNSPTYTMVALEDISRMLNQIKDKECIRMIKDLNDMGWRCMAHHFHQPTGQWSGPHSRCYSSIQGKELWSKIQLSVGEGLQLLPEDEVEAGIETYRIRLRCPDKYKVYFEKFCGARTEKSIYVKKSSGRKSETAICYIDKYYSIGTFYKSDFWNQRRAFVAYFGTRERPICLRLRCLHDGYDYSSGTICSVQSKGRVLSAINFATDGGDTHCNLDMVENATIGAKDLRLRFEITGLREENGVPSKWTDGCISIASENVILKLKVLYSSFGDNDICYKVQNEDGKIYLDIILYSGEKKNICFKDLKASCTMAFFIGSIKEDVDASDAICQINDNNIRTIWKENDEVLKIDSPVKCGTFDTLYRSCIGYVNDKEFDEDR
ncbi:MAG TPA: hypothetical protein DD426_07380 [Clostridiaceae bacterium]|nr:hypothetical protein [Clostridiaceae bacterium]